ncbi:MAG TPA: tRNA guanosine(34) transglycosylase Tgt [Candidatus Paceibacterota bacterium]
MNAIKFDIVKKMSDEAPGSLGRAGVISTAHGNIQTPAFVTVGTKATVKGITPEMLKETGAQVMLANTYHLYLQPGDELIHKAGGLGRFSGWNGPTMTDSGGFQAFSLGAAFGKDLGKLVKGEGGKGAAGEMPLSETTETAKAMKAKAGGRDSLNAQDGAALKPAQVDENGVMFRSVIDGSAHYFSPEKSIAIQHNIGADMIFAFDECTSPTESLSYQRQSLDRTHRWAKQCLQYHHSKDNAERQALFGVLQGGRFEDLRKESAEKLAAMRITDRNGVEQGFDGFGIGGSFAKEDMSSAVAWVNSVLPEEKPRHLLGIGEPEDLFMAVEQGCDLFDCVLPTRNGRTGTVFTKYGKVNIGNTKYRDDLGPIDEGCECYACKNYSRAYVAHLFHAKEMLAGTLASIHNLHFLIKLVDNMRQAILDGNFAEYKKNFLGLYLKD